MIGELEKELEAFATQISEPTVTHDCVKTELGDFFIFRTQAIQGRNPRTGETLPEIPGKTFKYFLVSQRLFNIVFPSSLQTGYEEGVPPENTDLTEIVNVIQVN